MGIFSIAELDDGPDSKPVQKVGPSQATQPRNVSVIGPTLVFKGELSADEDLIIEGQVEGTIAHHKKHLTVGKQGRVQADIHASSVIVLGQLVGNIHSDGVVSLAKGSEVTGDITCARISMEDGARFSGKIDMGKPVAVKESRKEPPVNRRVVEAVRKEISPEPAGQAAKPGVV